MKNVNKKSKISNTVIYIAIFCIISVIVIVLLKIKFSRVYILNVPKIENTEDIVISLQNDKSNSVNYDSADIMNDILKVLSGGQNGKTRTTKIQSVNDNPSNVSNVIVIKFNLKNSDATSIAMYVYNKDKAFYIEQPYNGIYRISPDEYNSIKNLIIK